ncbi:CopD family protein, partial [Mycobacterium tuberculosis]|nr:CopD family protein [Mycobacterium tuberculosis]
SRPVPRSAGGRNATPARFWRMMNEVPTVLMIIIVIMVIIKPF